MVENADKVVNEDKNEFTPQVEFSGQSLVPEKERPNRIEIKGSFNKSPSSYWSFALPGLSLARYISEGMRKELTRRHEVSKLPAWLQKKPSAYFEKAYAVAAGGFMTALTTFYMVQTYRDIRNVFSKSLSWEFNKKPEDVNVIDILKSKNTLVQAAKRNIFKYGLRRYAINSIFFSSFLPGKHLEGLKPQPETAVYLGVGATSGYLMMDVFNRKETFFERLQEFIVNKINHTNTVGEMITSTDLVNLYLRHARDKNHNYSQPRMDSKEWQDDQVLFGRIAELMNQTYGNEVPHEKANFTISKLIYLLGFGLVKSDSLEKNLLYVEIANRYDIPDAYKAAQALKDGASVDEVMKRYPVTLPVNKQHDGVANDIVGAAETQETKPFIDKIISGSRVNMQALAASNTTHAEKVRKSNDNALAASGLA